MSENVRTTDEARAEPGCWYAKEISDFAALPRSLPGFRTIEPVIVSVGTIALLLLGTGAVLVAWLFSA